MKKTIVNFQIPLYTILFSVLFLMTSCQKENIQPAFNKVTAELNTNKTTTEIHERDLSNIATQMHSNARNNPWLIANEYIENDGAGPYLESINVEDLPNPSTHRVEVRIIPFDKPTNLKIQAWNRNRPQIFTDIIESNNPEMEVDFVKFRANDLLAQETNAIIRVDWEGIGNKFELKIYAIPVDCQENRPRRQGDVGQDFQPVCGCDGRTYFDQTAAYNAGITSWERGQCIPILNIPIEGIWENVNVESPIQYLDIIRKIAEDCEVFSVQLVDGDNYSPPHRFLYCPDKEADTTPERTWTVVDEKKEGFPLIWPVEKWSAQVNDQGELELIRTNGADKDKEDKKEHATILSRFKRIK